MFRLSKRLERILFGKARRLAPKLKFPQRFIGPDGRMYVMIFRGLAVGEDGKLYSVDMKTGKVYPLKRVL